MLCFEKVFGDRKDWFKIRILMLEDVCKEFKLNVKK